jgi:hypothetical protein
MLAAGVAELRELKPAGGRLLVLGRGVVPVLAIRALQCNDLAHCDKSPSKVASHLGWQAAVRNIPDTPQHRVMWLPAAKS